MKIDKSTLKRLIKEVVSDIIKEMTVDETDTDTSNTMKNSMSQANKEKDTVIKLTVRGLKPGRAYKDVMAKLAYDAKKADLEAIHAEIESNGKSIDSMDAGELKNAAASQEDDDYDITPAKSITRRTSKEKPPLPVSPEQWKEMEKRDLVAARQKAQLKAAKIKSGTYDASDTSLWSDDDWDKWEKERGAAAVSKKAQQ